MPFTEMGLEKGKGDPYLGLGVPAQEQWGLQQKDSLVSLATAGHCARVHLSPALACEHTHLESSLLKLSQGEAMLTSRGVLAPGLLRSCSHSPDSEVIIVTPIESQYNIQARLLGFEESNSCCSMTLGNYLIHL